MNRHCPTTVTRRSRTRWITALCCLVGGAFLLVDDDDGPPQAQAPVQVAAPGRSSVGVGAIGVAQGGVKLRLAAETADGVQCWHNPPGDDVRPALCVPPPELKFASHSPRCVGAGATEAPAICEVKPSSESDEPERGGQHGAKHDAAATQRPWVSLAYIDVATSVEREGELVHLGDGHGEEGWAARAAFRRACYFEAPFPPLITPGRAPFAVCTRLITTPENVPIDQTLRVSSPTPTPTISILAARCWLGGASCSAVRCNHAAHRMLLTVSQGSA
jgi:hypothetical protein